MVYKDLWDHVVYPELRDLWVSLEQMERQVDKDREEILDHVVLKVTKECLVMMVYPETMEPRVQQVSQDPKEMLVCQEHQEHLDHKV